MTTRIDNDAIKHDVTKFYRYGMFSHKWENNEPLFEQVIRIVVYDLGESPTQDKLKMFCKIVLDAGLHWAWSDTCCINRADYSVLQEALVAIFKWYEESSLTIIFLCDVLSPSRRGDLTKSIWKSRAWIFQEYRASKVVRFYTKDWKLYMNLDIPNHKDSPEIISEMEEATGVSERALMALRPGLADIREKLWLASTRQTTLVEDMAYSLFGIFSASFPDVNGEGDQALGQLLAQLLRSSGDISILAWTGKCGSFNSCFPASITVFNQRPPPHIPFAMPSTKIEKTIARFCFSSSSLLSVMNLYGRLNELPAPSFCGQRLHLPCLVFKLWRVRRTREAVGCVFHAEADTLGIVEIRTEEDLFQFGPLYLVHPWIDFLLGRQPVGWETKPEENAVDQASSKGAPPLTLGPSDLSHKNRNRSVYFHRCVATGWTDLHTPQRRCISAASLIFIGRRPTDASPPSDRSTATAIWCVVARSELRQRCYIPKGCCRDPYHCPSRGNHPASAEGTGGQRTRLGHAII